MSTCKSLVGITIETDPARDGYALRDECDDDMQFLQTLYASTRTEEMAAIQGWTVAQKHAFLTQQFAAQRIDYHTRIADCWFAVIERGGARVGRLYLQTRATQMHIVDIALLPIARGQGVGTAVLRNVVDVAHARCKGVGLVVEKRNPALRLYQRLGFVVVGETEMRWTMERAVSSVT